MLSQADKLEIRRTIIDTVGELKGVKDTSKLDDEEKLIKARIQAKKVELSELDNELTEKKEQLVISRTEIETNNKVAVEIKRANDAFVRSTRNEIQAKFDKEMAHKVAELEKREASVEDRLKQADMREKSLIARENAIKNERIELDKVADDLQAQTKELQDATKALHIKSEDYKHEKEANDLRSDELDRREAKLIAKES